MTRDEILTYLMQKRAETAGVASAQQDLDKAQNKLNRAKKMFNKTIITFAVLTVLILLLDGGAGSFIFALPAIVLFLIKYTRYMTPAQSEVDAANQKLNQEVANPVYQKGAQGFPEKFYNYSDAFRLWKLVSENRARDLQEAFNLLETQQFYEDQLSIQEEIKGLQQDIAANARLAATSSTISAINSFR